MQKMLKLNNYACFAYALDGGDVDIADGNVLEIDSHNVTIAYENARGPVTPTRISLSSILEHF